MAEAANRTFDDFSISAVAEANELFADKTDGGNPYGGGSKVIWVRDV